MMAGLQASFRIFCKNDPPPAILVAELNTALKENLPQSKFVTLFLGRLDTNTGTIEYANAGHAPPLWIRKSGVEELAETDLVLGVVTRADFFNRRLRLDPGDSLVLFTDGVSEAENGEGQELSPMQFANLLSKQHGARAEEVTQALEEAVLHHVGDAPLADDVTLVVVSRDRVSE
jgi:sigma-B regulation protein RsbU (phosphoserine phosphatase)